MEDLNMVFEKVLSTINKHNLIDNGDKIVVGISGGPDSVCLLHFLNSIKSELNFLLFNGIISTFIKVCIKPWRKLKNEKTL